MDMFSSLEDHRNPHPSSLKAAFQETLAIAGGDAPQIFAQHQATRGHRTNAYRLARRQKAAFEWEAYFAERGDNVAIRRAKITSAFGVQWDTIRKWRSPIVLMLGTRDVEDSERYARLTAQQSWQLRGRKNNEIDALKFDGDAYRLELRRQKNSLEN